MRKQIALILCLVIALPAMSSAGLKRLDLSPMVLVNLDEDESVASSSRLLGGAMATDWYFTDHFAIRTSVGYVKNLYNTSVSRIDRLFGDPQPVESDNYSFRLSIAPYAEAHLAAGLRPYVTITGGVGYFDNPSNITDLGVQQSEVISNARYAASQSTANTYYDFSGAVGLKVPLFSSFSIFGEVSHRVYSSLDTDSYSNFDATYRSVPFGFDQYKTMLSVGMTLSLNTAGK